MKTRLVTVLSLILCVFMLLSSCASGTPEVTDNESSEPSVSADTSADTAPVLDLRNRIVTPELCYKLVRGDNAEQSEVNAALKIKNALVAKFGDMYTGGINSDFLMSNRKNETIDVDEYEILVGDTNRRESRDILPTLKENEYVIKTVGKKLVLIGENPYATLEACEYFISEVIEKCDASGLVFETDYLCAGMRKETRPPLADGATLRYMSWNLGCGVGVEADAVKVLDEYQPDIIALQESNPTIHSEVIDSYIKIHREYKIAVKTHPGSSTMVYTPIVYNSKKLTLVKGSAEWLDGRYTGTNTKCICWAVFDCADGRFAVINFHGAVCSNDYKGYENKTSEELNAIASQWRLDNVRQILDLKKKLTDTYGDIPMTVNGDCNFNENSQPYKNLISAGFADAEKTAKKIIKTGYKTSYSYKSGIPGAGLSIDHIFGINGVYFASWDIVRTSTVGTASDHTPVYVDYNPCKK